MRAKNQSRNFDPFGKSLGRALLNEGLLTVPKCRISSKFVSHLATFVAIADENILPGRYEPNAICAVIIYKEFFQKHLGVIGVDEVN